MAIGWSSPVVIIAIVAVVIVVVIIVMIMRGKSGDSDLGNIKKYKSELEDE